MKDNTPIEKSSLLNDACNIIDQAQFVAYHAVDVTLLKRNWLLGLRIHKVENLLKDQSATISTR